MKQPLSLTVLLDLTLFTRCYAQEPGIPMDTAALFFDEYRGICEKEDGCLWELSLYGPVLFIDRETRFIAANQPDSEGLLTLTGTLYKGYFPETKNIANSWTEFGGTLWTMLA